MSKDRLNEADFRNLRLERGLDPHGHCHNGRRTTLACACQSDLNDVIRIDAHQDDVAPVCSQRGTNLILEHAFDPLEQLGARGRLFFVSRAVVDQSQ